MIRAYQLMIMRSMLLAQHQSHDHESGWPGAHGRTGAHRKPGCAAAHGTAERAAVRGTVERVPVRGNVEGVAVHGNVERAAACGEAGW